MYYVYTKDMYHGTSYFISDRINILLLQGNNLLKVQIQAKNREKGIGFNFDRQHVISRCYRQSYRADNITIDSRISGHRQPYLTIFLFFIKSARGQK